ncbi:MAG: CYTH domain-containing protein [Muribaculaceae bacterium]|nr:CYTH domain-containing protein [Muribaculaceae bacterium]
MAKEIERTFLVDDDSFKEMAVITVHILQGYLNRDPERTVRVRILNDSAFLTVKGKTEGCERDEFEYEVPLEDGLEMMKLCSGRILDKTRYIVPYEGYSWEVDEYHGDLEGLVVTEVEMKSAKDDVPIAPFAGREVTGDPRYFNSQL